MSILPSCRPKQRQHCNALRMPSCICSMAEKYEIFARGDEAMATIRICDNCGTQLKTWRDDCSRQYEALCPDAENARLRFTIRIEMALNSPPGEWATKELCALCIYKWLEETLPDMVDLTPVPDEVRAKKLVER